MKSMMDYLNDFSEYLEISKECLSESDRTQISCALSQTMYVIFERTQKRLFYAELRILGRIMLKYINKGD